MIHFEIIKNYTHVKKVGHTSKFLSLMAFTDELQKQIFIKETVKVCQLKKTIVFTMFHFSRKNKEKRLEIQFFTPVYQ